MTNITNQLLTVQPKVMTIFLSYTLIVTSSLMPASIAVNWLDHKITSLSAEEFCCADAGRSSKVGKVLLITVVI